MLLPLPASHKPSHAAGFPTRHPDPLPLLPTTLLSLPLTFEADVQGHPGQRGIDDVAQINLLLLVEVKLPAPARGETERNELLSVEAVEWLEEERDTGVRREPEEARLKANAAPERTGLTTLPPPPAPAPASTLCVPVTSTFFSFSA